MVYKIYAVESIIFVEYSFTNTRKPFFKKELIFVLKPLRPETCGLTFMRAAMSALATVHATAYGYQESCGGRKAFLERYPLIKDQNRLPKFSEMKVN